MYVSSPAWSGRDHPRVCGEHVGDEGSLGKGQGSSPRMRGALAHALLRIGPGRIIPADAGSTIADALQAARHADHPRVCGEHYQEAVTELVEAGSSPRMRGARRGYENVPCENGIIPAYAGSTCRMTLWTVPSGDHPRVCGEHVVPRRAEPQRLGSSPRMRGAQRVLTAVHYPEPIIPAYAGSTSPTTRPTRQARDHPRICGEHDSTQRGIDYDMRSSPHMRGALYDGATPDDELGIIPAYAGSTCASFACHCIGWDHPRICGEHH